MFASPVSSLPVALRRAGLVSLACSVLVLTACGGGDRASDYKPTSIVSFGDENSAFASASVTGGSGEADGKVTGLTYSVNVLSDLTNTETYCADLAMDALCGAESALTGDVTNFEPSSTTTAYFASANTPPDLFNVVTELQLGKGTYESNRIDLKRTINQFYNCKATTIWTQYVARAFGKGYEADCQLDQPGAVSYAKAGATVDTLADQIKAATDKGQLKSGTLVTVWLGQNDLVEIFDSPASLAEKKTAAGERAKTLIQGVKQILATGAKVVLANAPNLAYSPYALGKPGVVSDCAGVNGRSCNAEMEALVVAFNEQLITSLGTEYALNGRQLGYVDAAQLTNTYARSTSYENKALCADSLQPLSCHTQNVVAGGSISTYLWADDLRVSWTLHNIIGQTALTRATEQF